MDFPDVRTTADHAYWLSGIALRDGGGEAPLGTIDARSRGFGRGDPRPGATRSGAGALSGGNLGSLAFTSRSKAWGAASPLTRADVLDVRARNIRRVTVHPQRARLTCAAELRVDTDGPITVSFAGCDRAETVRSAASPVRAPAATPAAPADPAPQRRERGTAPRQAVADSGSSGGSLASTGLDLATLALLGAAALGGGLLGRRLLR
jgi:hypothetical protein